MKVYCCSRKFVSRFWKSFPSYLPLLCRWLSLFVLSSLVVVFDSNESFADSLSQQAPIKTGDGIGLSFALKGSTQPAFSFFQASPPMLQYSELMAGGFATQEVDRSLVEIPSIRVDDYLTVVSRTALVFLNDSPHIIYYDSAHVRLMHAYVISGSWITEVVDDSNNAGGSPSAAICGVELCISYYDTLHKSLRFVRGRTGFWNPITLDGFGNDVGAMSAVAVDSQGQPAVAYYDATKQQLKVASQSNGGQWTFEIVAYPGRSFGLFPSMIIAQDSSIHLSASRYKNDVTPADLGVYYATKPPDGNWNVTEVSTDYAGGSTNLIFDSDNKPELLYRSLGYNNVYGNFNIVTLARLQDSGLWIESQIGRIGPQEGAPPIYGDIQAVRSLQGDLLLAHSIAQEVTSGQQIQHSYRLYSSCNSLGTSSGFPVSCITSVSSDPTSSSPSTPPNGGSDGNSSGNIGAGDGSPNNMGEAPNSTNGDDSIEDPSDIPSEGNNGGVEQTPATDSQGPGGGDGSQNDPGVGRRLQPRSGAAAMCSEWNGFLGGMFNILENVNLSLHPLTVQATLYNSDGEPRSPEIFTISPGAQHDVLVHDMPGFVRNSVGKVCVAHLGQNGDLDGRMVHYRTNQGGFSAAEEFEFALSMPFSYGFSGDPYAGDYYVPFNTYQPSLASKDGENLVANWIQITNFSNSVQSGALFYFNMDGTALASEQVSIPGGARRDFSAHRFGPRYVGIIRWHPDDSNAQFQLRNVRYFYDNALGRDSFDTAFQVEGSSGSGEPLSALLDTRETSAILEIANVRDIFIHAKVNIHNEQGELLYSTTLPLQAHASFHIIADSILQGQKGIATIQGSGANSLIAVSMHYKRKTDGGVQYIYGFPAQKALGSVLRGSYNTYLDQHSEMVILNPTSKTQAAWFSLVRSDGRAIVGSSVIRFSPTKALLLGEKVSVPAHGVKVVDLNRYEQSDNYGVITIQPEGSDSLVAWVLREKGGEYVMTTAVRE